MTKRLLAAVLFCALLAPAFAADKPIITVLDFSTDGVSQSEMQTIINLLSSALFQTQKYTVIDVKERERLLKELEFSVSGCTDESCLLEAGRLLSAEAIVVGNIGKVGTRYILSTKMLETETGRTLNTADGIYPNLDALVDDLFTLAAKLSKGPGEAAAEPRAEPAVKEEPIKEPVKEPAVTEEPKKEKPAELPPPEEAVKAAGGNYFSLEASGGLTLPLGAVSDLFALGYPGLLAFGFNLERPWGVLGFALASGFQYQPTRTSVRYRYTMLTVPAAVQLSYHTNSRFYVGAKLLGGAAESYIKYREVYEFRENLWTLSPFAAAALELGYRIVPKLALELSTLAPVIFFDQTRYLGITPTLGVELRL